MNIHCKKQVAEIFTRKFHQNPLLVFSPGRINLIGEHTDYNDGFVFPAAIDKGIYLAIGISKNNTSSISAVDLEEQYDFILNEEIKPLVNNRWENYVLGVISELQKKGKTIPNINIAFKGDIPVGAGLSSSAALENAVVFGLNELLGLHLSKEEMIFISQKAEHHFVGVKCGIMDQFASMFGEKNSALHLDCRSLIATSYTINLGNYELVLINSNVKHSLANSAYNDRRTVCEKVANLLNVKALRDVTVNDLNTITSQLTKEDYDKAMYVIQENERTLKAATAFINNDIKALGQLVFDSHEGLSEKYKVSCLELDFLVQQAMASDAVIGARMMGGGFGGCTINIIESAKKEVFIKEIQQKYKNEFNNTCAIYEVTISEGTRVISQ